MARIGVCSWSLHPDSPADLVHKVRACGLGAVQLALDPIRSGRWPEVETSTTLHAAGITILSGMMAMEGEDYSSLDSIRRTGGVRPDAHWARNLEHAGANALLARRLGITLVTFHAGFLPHDAGDPIRATMLDRLRQVTDAFAQQDILVAFETGQESAATLSGVLRQLNRPTVGVNFDPANMILYGMGDPVQALSTLVPWVRQVHVKDARPTSTPGTWGRETPAGQGAVDWPAFFRVVREHRIDVGFVIEREGGDTRIDDIRHAWGLIDRSLPPAGDHP
jgi:L-ribulose-5-phosphate 3-epimerase